MSETDAAQSALCFEDKCDRDVADEQYCYWHRKEIIKEPLTDDSTVGEIPENLASAYLKYADLTNTNLTEADLTDADLTNADLTNANLTNANLTNTEFTHTDLTNANLTDTDLTDASLWRANLTGADLTSANLTDADLINADLRDADFTNVNLSSSNINGSNLLDSKIKDAKVNRQTKFGSRLPEWFSNMTAHARTYHELRTKLSREGYGKPTRDLYVLEQKARTRAAFPRDPITFFGGLLSGLLTGYGVRPRRVFFSTTFLIALTTLWFSQAGVVYEGWNTTYELLGFQLQTGSLHYSVVTFVTSPPHPPQSTDLLTNLFVTVETYLGTVLTLLLGYTLSNRSRV